MRIDKIQMRNFIVNYHGFNEFFGLDSDSAAKAIFDRIQSVQFDPLNVVGRNAELVLFARSSTITREDFYNALYSDRLLVDGWDKMMCIYPAKDFTKFKRVRDKATTDYECTIIWRKQTECYKYLDEVYDYIATNGPTLVSDIPSVKANSCNWGPSRLSGVCCEYLWNCGKLTVVGKKGVVKVFDTTERVFGKGADTADAFTDESEFLRWYFLRRIAAVGAAPSVDGGAWLGPYVSEKAIREKVLAELVESGEILPVYIEGDSKPFYIRAQDEHYFNSQPKCDRASFIAPLDNMIWDRKALKRIFDFEYSWEVYTPAAKRKYGYYVLPILIGNRLVGRLEPVQYKQGEPLKLKNIWFESAVTDTEIELIVKEFSRLAAFLGVEPESGLKEKIAAAV